MTKSDHNKLLRSVVTKLHPEKLSDVSFTGDGRLADSIVLLVGGRTSMATQFTIHRPIGITRLETDEWVMTPTTEVNYLIAREKDPGAQRITEMRNRNRLNYLVKVGLLILNDGTAYYVADPDGKARKVYLAESEAKAKEKGDKNRYAYLPEEIKVIEAQISTVLKTEEGKAAVEMGVDDTYQTMGGVLENIPQVPVPAFKGKKPFELGGLIPKLVMTNIGLGKGAKVEVFVNPEKTKGNREDLEEDVRPNARVAELENEILQLEWEKNATEKYAGDLLTLAAEAIKALPPGAHDKFMERLVVAQSAYQEALSHLISDNSGD